MATLLHVSVASAVCHVSREIISWANVSQIFSGCWGMANAYNGWEYSIKGRVWHHARFVARVEVTKTYAKQIDGIWISIWCTCNITRWILPFCRTGCCEWIITLETKRTNLHPLLLKQLFDLYFKFQCFSNQKIIIIIQWPVSLRRKTVILSFFCYFKR